MAQPQARRNIPQAVSNKVYHGKFIMAILVVLIHTFNLPAYGEAPRDGLYYFEMLVTQNIARVAVPMFFFFSGLFFFLDTETPKDATIRIGKRCKSVVIPYLLWNSIYTLLFLGVLRLPFFAFFYANRSSVESGECAKRCFSLSVQLSLLVYGTFDRVHFDFTNFAASASQQKNCQHHYGCPFNYKYNPFDLWTSADF